MNSDDTRVSSRGSHKSAFKPMARERIDFQSNTDSLFLLADAPTGNLDSLRTAKERTAPLSADQRVEAGFGATYLITRGGGAGLHDVNCRGSTDVALEMFNYLRIDVDGGMLIIRATGVDGNEIERFILRPQPAIAEASLTPGLPASIFGQNLAVKQETAIGEELPLLLGGVRVQLDGRDHPAALRVSRTGECSSSLRCHGDRDNANSERQWFQREANPTGN